jgi:hypothetical protein
LKFVVCQQSQRLSACTEQPRGGKGAKKRQPPWPPSRPAKRGKGMNRPSPGSTESTTRSRCTNAGPQLRGESWLHPVRRAAATRATSFQHRLRRLECTAGPRPVARSGQRPWRVTQNHQAGAVPPVARTASKRGRGLTPRSSGAPTAGHLGPAGGTRYIFTGRAKASCRCRPLTSHVRRPNTTVFPLQTRKRIQRCAQITST